MAHNPKREQFKKLIDAKMQATGCDRTAAAKAVMKEHPELREQVVTEANEPKSGAA